MLPKPCYREAVKDSGCMNTSKMQLKRSVESSLNVMLKNHFGSANWVVNRGLANIGGFFANAWSFFMVHPFQYFCYSETWRLNRSNFKERHVCATLVSTVVA
jgi:hypothetical protein